MDTVKELLQSLSITLRQRLGNPLIGAFVISWAAWNFRFLMVVFGGDTSASKISYIDTHLYPSSWDWLALGIVYPGASSLAFVISYPFVNRWLLTFYGEQHKKTVEKLLFIEGTTPLSPEAADSLRLRTKKKEEHLQAMIKRQSEEIDDLNGALRAASETAKPTEIDLESSHSNVSKVTAKELAEKHESKQPFSQTSEIISDPSDRDPAGEWHAKIQKDLKSAIFELKGVAHPIDKFMIDTSEILGGSLGSIELISKKGISQALFLVLVVCSNENYISIEELYDILKEPKNKIKIAVDQGITMSIIEYINVGKTDYRGNAVDITEKLKLAGVGLQVLDSCLARLPPPRDKNESRDF